MFAGFDYGTSNCAMSVVVDEQVKLVPLYGENHFVPSTVYALERGFIADFIYQQLTDGVDKVTFARSRSAFLNQARVGKITHSLNSDDGIFFGDDAIEQYVAAPHEGYFIKSPKSFLGASGLRQQFVDFFEDIVAAMMLNVKRRAELHLGKNITQTVIGRPVNFQGIHSHKSNEQAQAILMAAGKRAGFSDIEFLYEPLAAGFDFETRLTESKIVLVVDIGGGTTDCSMVIMGPDHIAKLNRTNDFLGHTGARIGGNDFDIQLAQKIIMPEFGMLSPLKNGLPMPVMPFINAMAINDVGAQAEFYEVTTSHLLEKLKRETVEPDLFTRFLTMREGKHNFSIVRTAEMGKIALSTEPVCNLPLSFIEKYLAANCSSQQFSDISETLLQDISSLLEDVVKQAGRQPDIVYLTGGSAKSPLFKSVIQNIFSKEMVIVDGDHFGSVASGLGVWANRIFS